MTDTMIADAALMSPQIIAVSIGGILMCEDTRTDALGW